MGSDVHWRELKLLPVYARRWLMNPKVGIVLSYWLDFGMSYASGPVAWRFPIAFQLVFAIIVTVLIFGLPESPR